MRTEKAQGASLTPYFDEAISVGRLREGFERVRANNGCAGGDGVDVGVFGLGLDMRLSRLHAELLDGSYRPGPTAHFEIPKKNGSIRELNVPCVRDRVAQSAAALTLSSLFEKSFEDASHAYRPGRGVATAVRAVAYHAADGFGWVVDADIKAYFDNVPHVAMLAAFSNLVPEKPFLNLVRLWLGQSRFCERGLPQGAPISPLLANLYLDRIDEAMGEAGYRLVRYADDFVILCRSAARAEKALALAAEVLLGLGLELHPEKTVIRPLGDGFDFLGQRLNRTTLALQLAELASDTDDLPKETKTTAMEAAPISGEIVATRHPIFTKTLAEDTAPPSDTVEASRLQDEMSDDRSSYTSRHAPFVRTLYMLEKGRRLDRYQSALGVYDGQALLAVVMGGTIDRIDVFPGAEMTADALRLAASHGIAVFLVDGHGVQKCAVLPETEARSKLHFRQASVAFSEERSIALARQFVAGRIWNARRLLQRLKGRLESAEPQHLAGLEKAIIDLDHIRRKAEQDPKIVTLDMLRGQEANAARQYWPALASLLKRGHGDDSFKRSRRPPQTPFNATLNWTSHLLQRDIHTLGLKHGIHTGFGVLHSIEDQKDSCVFDLMEEFRAPIAEALAAQLLSTGALTEKHFDHFTMEGQEAIWLVNGASTKIVRAYERQMDRRIRNNFTGQWTTWRGIIDYQIGAYIRHVLDGEPYAYYRMDF